MRNHKTKTKKLTERETTLDSVHFEAWLWRWA